MSEDLTRSPAQQIAVIWRMYLADLFNMGHLRLFCTFIEVPLHFGHFGEPFFAHALSSNTPKRCCFM